MYLSARILGKGIADAIAARAATPLLTIGKDQFFRRDLAQIACFNFTAATNLDRLIASFGVRDTRDLYENVPPTALVLPRLGSISLAVLGAAFELKGLGGDTPLETWMTKHRPEGATKDVVAFTTLKHAEHLREAGETRARKQRSERTQRRRDQAHRIRLERYLTRQERTHARTR